MAIVFIEDELLDSYEKACTSHDIFDVASRISGLIQRDLSRLGAPDLHHLAEFRDRLTKCRSRRALEEDLSALLRRHLYEGRFLADEAALSADLKRHLYEGRFLCIDIDNFKAFHDHHGHTHSDEILRQIGVALMNDYEPKRVYRTGGDEFVVLLPSDAQMPLPQIEGIVLKHSRVEVRVTGTQEVHHTVRWILNQLDRGIVEARPQGHVIPCGDPPSHLASGED